MTEKELIEEIKKLCTESLNYHSGDDRADIARDRAYQNVIDLIEENS